MKKYLTFVIFPLVSILTLPILFSIFNLFGIEVSKIFYTFFIILIMIISGIILGLNIKDKGYIKGLLYGIGISLTMFILSFILLSDHSIYNILYYIIIIATTTLGTMIGINKKG